FMDCLMREGRVESGKVGIDRIQGEDGIGTESIWPWVGLRPVHLNTLMSEEEMEAVHEKVFEWILDSSLSYEQVHERLVHGDSLWRMNPNFKNNGQRVIHGQVHSALRYSLYYWWLVH